ncbi:glycosyltransferase family 9 protein [Autumnicola musiva]|uniref:Glycosyltransferase family 9 protein n=1 Tax=Autumnicola musiva TaxID=3075589 RepID=A0ABU3D378_9FLAO|nr:glycosyltransferase family 9 protein [Zunongwangia sp. F117]MDT0675987.1 glycosyltransferase family 9 protein [Zunongwangia sp. F117]
MKILVIQQKMIGDVLTSSILFEALRKKFPEAELHYLIYPHTFPVIENNPYIDKVVFFDPEKDKTPQEFLLFQKKIRSENYDVVLDVYSMISTAVIAKASGAKIRAGYGKKYTKFLYTHNFKYKKKVETKAGLAVENRMLLLKAISKDFPVEINPKIYLTSKEMEAAEAFLRQHQLKRDKPVIMMSILGSSDEKTYPLEYMAQIMDFIVETTGAQILFNYIPRQKEKALKLYELCNARTKVKIFPEAFAPDLRKFLALTKRCNAVIGNEGGCINMAKALDVPTFSIFSPQITKEAWSLYENDQNVAVHFYDFLSSYDISKKDLKKQSSDIYNQFKPRYILPKLAEFLGNLKIS